MSYPEIDRAVIKQAISGLPLHDVVAAPEGRFILPVPDLKDGKGPLLAPNIKELEARLHGSEGHVQALKLEANPQKIPADGSNVIVINRVDEFVQLALKAKLQDLVLHTGDITRQVITDFMSYARGYSYNPEKQIITFTKGAGFHNDVYNMPLDEFKKRYVSFTSVKMPLDGKPDAAITAGYYVKKPLASKAAFISGKFAVRLGAHAGGAMQEFDKGAMINLPDDASLPLTFIHPTDIDICYRKPDGSSLIDKNGAPTLPVYNVSDLQSPKQPVRAKQS